VRALQEEQLRTLPADQLRTLLLSLQPMLTPSSMGQSSEGDAPPHHA
jgi:hypothetical protein